MTSKYGINVNACDSKSNATIDVKCRFLSECTTLNDDKKIVFRKVHSAPELKSVANSDDTYGTWQFHNILLHSPYSCPSSKLITFEDIACMRKERDKKLILLFLGKIRIFCLELSIIHNLINEIYIVIIVSTVFFNLLHTCINVINVHYCFQKKRFHVTYHARIKTKRYLYNFYGKFSNFLSINICKIFHIYRYS